MSEIHDDEPTRLAGNAPAPVAAKAQSNVLPTGTRLGEFEITKVIGVGGFGIVYLAHDHSLQRVVALKEYMPVSFAKRADGLTVTLTADEHAETFGIGLKSFVNEALLLAQFDHASLVKVYRFWEANGTAYMVMPYFEAPTLKAVLATMGERPSEQWLKEFLSQILDALDIIHAKQCYHRDIAPDNILMLGGQRPVLLDFGAARRVIEGREQALTVILKAGYAPIEQYGSSGEMLQGPWTDLYALASVVYYALTGKVPPPAVQRVVGVDSCQPLAKIVQGQYSEQFLNAIDAALAIQPHERPQSVAQFRELLGLDNTYFRQVSNMGAATTHTPTTTPTTTPTGNDDPTVMHARPAVATPVAPPPVVPVAAPPKAGKPWLIPAVVAALAVLGVAGWLLRPVSTVGPAASTPVVVASASASIMASAAPVSSSVSTPTPAPTPAPKPEFDPVQQLNNIVVARDPQHDVLALAAQNQVRIDKDKFRFSITSSRAGYVYVLFMDAKHEHLFLMFPNKKDKQNRIEVGKTMQLPGSKWPLVASGPVGMDQFVVIVSQNERDFSGFGLQAGGLFDEINLAKAKSAYQADTGTLPLFAGKAVCKKGNTGSTDSSECANSYGAATFSVDEVKR